MDTKREIRKLCKMKRDAMSRAEVDALSARICEHLLNSPLFERARYLCAYYPLGNEADARPVAEAAWERGKRVALPRVSGDEMRYFEVSAFGELQPGAFGVMEPPGEGKPVHWWHGAADREEVLVLTPGVAFDRSGNRLGFGRGYYDRCFAGEEACVRVGVAYEMQLVPEIPAEESDVPLPYLVTETGIYA